MQLAVAAASHVFDNQRHSAGVEQGSAIVDVVLPDGRCRGQGLASWGKHVGATEKLGDVFRWLRAFPFGLRQKTLECFCRILLKNSLR